MSYILEALKKAQAERQLGSAPTLHAVPVGAAPHYAAGARRPPAWIALAVVALAVVLAVLALLAWRAQTPGARPAAPLTVVAAHAPPKPISPTAPLAVVPPSSPVAVLVPAPAPAPAPAPKPIVARALPPAPGQVAAPVAPPAAEPEDEKLLSLRELPEAIQRTVPPLTFGGYMYSKNPADRLLLIDKSLRHEGEEVAPGLVLEKLLPKAAVMNYKGYRYRVPY
jgi:general secretion pathway protein B